MVSRMTNHMDDLAKALASGMSRRKALKMFGAGLLGSAAVTLWPNSAGAAAGGNSACAQFCNSVFGAGTPKADACISDAARGRGMCYGCGPKSDGSQVVCGTVCCPTGSCVTASEGVPYCAA
jgi:hypothetical protein